MAQQNDGRGNDMRQPARPAPRAAARQPQQPQTFNQQEDQFSRGFDEGVGQGAQEPRQASQARQQPSFSAYRPEAYANQEKPAARQAPAAPAPEPFRPAAASRQQHHDPYAASDPYDSGHNDASWQSFNDYPDNQRTQQQFSGQSFYQEHDEPANTHDAQSMHDQFFSAEPEQPQRAAPPPKRAAPPPPPPQQPARYVPDNDFEADDGFAQEPPPPPVPARAAPKPVPARPSREPDRGFEEDEGDFGNWDNNNFGQQPPAPDSARPFAQNKFGADDDLDADYLHDEDEFEGEEDYAEPKKGGKKLMAAVLVGAVVTGGGLAYLYKSSMGGAETGEPALVTADVRPIKEKPADPGGREFPNGGKLIYDRLDGAPAADGATRVAAREEGNSGNDVPGVVTTGSNGTLEERIQTALQNAKKPEDGGDQTSASGGNADAPRPVRTEIYRPDGSVDSARPQRRQAAAEAEPARVASREAAPSIAAAPARAQIAAVAPAISSGGDPGMFVQIAARNDEAAAMAAFADLKQKYASVLGAHSPSVRKVDLGEKGVWYRLLVGPMPSKADADKLCEDLKTAGMKGCFSRKE